MARAVNSTNTLVVAVVLLFAYALPQLEQHRKIQQAPTHILTAIPNGATS